MSQDWLDVLFLSRPFEQNQVMKKGDIGKTMDMFETLVNPNSFTQVRCLDRAKLFY